jgi:cell division protein FtsB
MAHINHACNIKNIMTDQESKMLSNVMDITLSIVELKVENEKLKVENEFLKEQIRVLNTMELLKKD